MTDFCVNCCNKEDDLICAPCHHKTLKIYENKLISEFLSGLRELYFKLDFRGEIDKRIYSSFIEKWEGKLKDISS